MKISIKEVDNENIGTLRGENSELNFLKYSIRIF